MKEEELQKAKQLIQEKWEQAGTEIEQIRKHEQQKRQAIVDLERSFRDHLQAEQQSFVDTMNQKFATAPLEELNEQLQTAMANNDQEEMRRILQKMANA